MDGGPHSHPGAILFVPCDSVPCSEVSRWSYAALLSPRYRYNVARLTPRYLAMSLPV